MALHVKDKSDLLPIPHGKRTLSSTNPLNTALKWVKGLKTLVMPDPKKAFASDTFKTEETAHEKREAKLYAAKCIIQMAFRGKDLPGLREMMPPRSLYGEASYASEIAFWREALGNKPLEDIALELKGRVACPQEINPRKFAESPQHYMSEILRTANHSDPEFIERAIRLLPKYTHFCGATKDPHDPAAINPAKEISELNALFAHGPIPAKRDLQVILVNTHKFGVLEVTRFFDFDDPTKINYSLGQNGAEYHISEKRGLSGISGVLPQSAVTDPRRLQFATYSELSHALKSEGQNFNYQGRDNQQPELTLFPPSGPQGLRYCSYEAQQSLEYNLPGTDQARLNSVNNCWNLQVRLDAFIAAARSPDVQVRELGTSLVAIILGKNAIPLLNEALSDRSPIVVEVAKRKLREIE